MHDIDICSFYFEFVRRYDMFIYINNNVVVIQAETPSHRENT